jgi:hypothetical protein
MNETELIHGIKTYLRRAAACTADAEKNQRAAGKLLAKLKDSKPKGQDWPSYVRKHFDLSQQRADELIRIAVGKITVAKTREGKRQRMRKSRAKAKSMPRGIGSNGNAKPVTCDFDPEHDKEEDWMTDEDIRSNAFRWQTDEAVRLAEECALLRPGASPSEITAERLKKIATVINAWRELHRKLQQTGGHHDKADKEEHRQALH